MLICSIFLHSILVQQYEVEQETNLFRKETHTHVRIICLISLTKKGIERFTSATLCWRVAWHSKCSYIQNPHKAIPLHTDSAKLSTGLKILPFITLKSVTQSLTSCEKQHSSLKDRMWPKWHILAKSEITFACAQWISQRQVDHSLYWHPTPCDSQWFGIDLYCWRGFLHFCSTDHFWRQNLE